ncbi:MAG: glycosyltransferase family protein [Patescibacteria group bacterium]
MNFLFIVQGEGRGHLTQALALKTILEKKGHKVVEVLVGKDKKRNLPIFFVEKIKVPVSNFFSPDFATTKKIRTNIWKSFFINLFKIPIFIRSIFFIRKKIKESNPDIIINLYDFLAGFSNFVFSFKKPFVCLANQYIFLHPDFEFPLTESKIEIKAMNLYNKITCLKADKIFALSLEKKEDILNKKIIVIPPILRPEVFLETSKKENYICGYLMNQFLVDKIKELHQKNPKEEWHFFWDKKDADEITVFNKTLFFHRLNDFVFLKYLSSCKGFIGTAGFESLAEAIYFEKPVAMIPTHIEQACNAFETEKNGAGIVLNDFDLEKFLNYIPKYKPSTAFKKWVESGEDKIIKEIENIRKK